MRRELYAKRQVAFSLKDQFREPKETKSAREKIWIDPVKTYIQEFGKESSLHGVGHILSEQRHPIERILWLIIFLSAFVYATIIIISSCERYFTNPTVVSLEKNHLDWNVTFPALTFYYLDRVNVSAVEEFVRNNMSTNDPAKAALYERFVTAVGNLTYDNMEVFKEFENEASLDGITSEMEDIAVKVQVGDGWPQANPVFDQPIKITPILGEFGLSFTSASPIAYHISPRPQRDSSIKKETYKADIAICKEFNGACTSMLRYPRPYKTRFSVHSPYEVQQASDKFHMLEPGPNDAFYVASAIISNEEVYRLKVSQRHCSITTEPQGNLPFSSYNTCLMYCRRRLAIKLCGCAPFFYNSLGGNDKVCNAKGLVCLSQHVHYLVQLFKEDAGVEKKESCGCLQPCDVVTYRKNKVESTNINEFGIFITYGLKEYTKTRYVKTVLFGIEDLLVSYGGTAGFFLGCSLLSTLELVYFFTLRLGCVIFSSCTRQSESGGRQKRQIRRDQWFQALRPSGKEILY